MTRLFINSSCKSKSFYLSAANHTLKLFFFSGWSKNAGVTSVNSCISYLRKSAIYCCEILWIEVKQFHNLHKLGTVHSEECLLYNKNYVCLRHSICQQLNFFFTRRHLLKEKKIMFANIINVARVLNMICRILQCTNTNFSDSPYTINICTFVDWNM